MYAIKNLYGNIRVNKKKSIKYVYYFERKFDKIFLYKLYLISKY